MSTDLAEPPATGSMAAEAAADDPPPDADALPGDPPGTPAPLDYFLELDLGDRTVWLELDSFTFATAEVNGRAIPSKVSTWFDLSTVDHELLAAIGAGRMLVEAQIEAHRAVGEGSSIVQEYRFGNVAIDRLLSSGVDGGEATQRLDFSYDRVQHGFVTYDEAGGSAVETSYAWDFALGRAVKPRGIQSEAPLSDSDQLEGQGGELSWFLRLGAAGQWLEAGTVSFGIAGPTGSRGAATAVPVEIGLGSDAIGPDLLEAVTKGRMFRVMELEAYRDGPEPQLVAEYRFGAVQVTGLATTGSGRLQQEASIAYETVTAAHIEQDESGGAVVDGPKGFDFASGQVVTSTYAVSADAPLAARDTIGGAPVTLQHFMRIDGIQGWVALSDFDFAIAREDPGGQAVSRATAGPVEVAFGPDSMSPGLFAMLAESRAAAEVEIEAYTVGGEPRLVDEFVFGDVALISLLESGATVAVQRLEMSFDSVEHAHVSYDIDGAIAGVNRKAFDFSTGRAVAVSSDADDLLS